MAYSYSFIARKHISLVSKRGPYIDWLWYLNMPEHKTRPIQCALWCQICPWILSLSFCLQTLDLWSPVISWSFAWWGVQCGLKMNIGYSKRRTKTWYSYTKSAMNKKLYIKYHVKHLNVSLNNRKQGIVYYLRNIRAWKYLWKSFNCEAVFFDKQNDRYVVVSNGFTSLVLFCN